MCSLHCVHVQLTFSTADKMQHKCRKLYDLAVVLMQGALAMAFVIEGLLFAFHLRGDLLDVEIHTLLVITIFLTAIVMFAEIQHKSNVLLSALRANLVLMQGVWFIQAAYILFRGKLCLTGCNYPI